MTPFSRDFVADYDLGDPELNERWDDLIPDLHAKCPVARSEVGEGYWILQRYSDVKRAAIDWQTFTNSHGFMVNRPEGLPYFAPGEVDPPLQTALRAAIHPFLTPKMAKELEPTIKAHADALIDSFIGTGEVEVVSQFANTLPQVVFSAEVAGMDAADLPYLMKCFDLTGPMEERGIGFVKGMEKIAEYLEQRRAEPPRGDIVDALLAFQHEGYTEADKIGTMSQLTIGGVGTTGYAFSGGLYHLATHPEDRKTLVADPKKLPRAIEEFLRMFQGAPNMARRATVDTEISGVKIKAGDRVLLSFGAASRDPEVVEGDPNVVDIDRKPMGHLGFGAGVHRCVGSPLALAILRVGFEQFLTRVGEFRVPEGFIPVHETGNVRQMAALPLLFTPGGG
ncbi:MAG: cytochrome P450 [Sporichthyaceae bacterium]